MNRLIAPLLAVALFLMLASPAGAAIEQYRVVMNGSSVVPPTLSSAAGGGSIEYNSATQLLSWNIACSGLSGTVTGHFHGPATETQTAGVTILMSGNSCPFVGSWRLTPTWHTDLSNQFWYVNFRTSTYQSGEIRGQILHSDSIPMMSNIGAGLLIAAILVAGRRQLRKPSRRQSRRTRPA